MRCKCGSESIRECIDRYMKLKGQREKEREKGRERGMNERRKRENVECACIMCAI